MYVGTGGTIMSSDDELAHQLQALVEGERPETIELLGPGPYELPKCSKAQAQPLNADHFVLELETEDRLQRLLIPVSTQALPALKLLVNHLADNLGIGQTKQ